MKFLLHRDTCIAWLRGAPQVRHHLAQNQGSLYVSAVTLMALGLYVLRAATPFRLQVQYYTLKQQLTVAVVDEAVAHRAALVGAGLTSPRLKHLDLVVVATALEQGLTLVTRNGRRYAHIPGLTLVDWTVP